MLPKKRILSIDISTGTYNDFIKEIVNLAKKKESGYICIANVHMTIEAHDNKDFQRIVNNAIITTPDGMPLVKAIKIFYGIHQDRVAGMDLFPDLLKECANNKLKVFLYGSTEKILSKIKEKAKKEFPNLEIVGSYSPPFRELTKTEKQNIINMINSLSPNIVFVSLGCPKQEKWMAEMYGKINALMIGVGGAFPVFAGEKKRAPKWMQNLSLEWLYRLIQEPKRLFKRYVYTNSKFLILLAKAFLKIKFYRRN